MNLLFDKRDSSEQPGQSAPDASSSGLSPKKPSKKKKSEQLKTPREKGTVNWLYLILIPIAVLVLAMTYVYYFHRDLLIKPKQNITISSKPVTIDTSSQAMDQDSLMLAQSSQDSAIQQQPPAMADGPEQVKGETNQPVRTTPPPAQQIPIATQTGANPSVQLLATIINKTSPGMSISSLYIDENTFSVGVKTGSSAELERFFNALSASLPTGAAITTKPSLSRNQSLIAGTYTTSSKPAQKQISANELSTEIRNIIQRNNTQRREINISQPQTRNNKRRSQGFVKVSGQLNNCQQVVSDILNGGWDISLSKVIVMPESTQSGTLVFWFFLNNPA